MALNNLRLEVIELRNEGLEKDKILISLVNKIKEDKASSKAHTEAQKNEIEDLRKQLAEAKEKCTVLAVHSHTLHSPVLFVLSPPARHSHVHHHSVSGSGGYTMDLEMSLVEE